MPQPAPIPQLATTTAIRSYRVYFRDTQNAIARARDVDLASDDDARQLAVLMLDEQTNYPCIEMGSSTARLRGTPRRLMGHQ